MTALVLRGGGVEDLAAAVTDVLGGALLALDAEGRRLAQVGEIDEPDRAEIVAAVAASRTEGRSVRRGRCGTRPWWPARRTWACWCCVPTASRPMPTSGSWSGRRW
ncbi:hypothetical protein [Verrucosispora sioxanthis]|uniref:hypothetical protein n=1 Tax=Verrucosispora sioxanthis TaxID=2499994 RepID=UPI002E2AEE31|nr:hypothetical protein [Verrucosispora sioxanthis]